MDLGDGGMISPRKKMAMGKEGSFKSDPFPCSGGVHPDASARTGDKGPMGEGERAVGAGVSRGGKEMPGQQAPDHGPTHNTNAAYRR